MTEQIADPTPQETVVETPVAQPETVVEATPEVPSEPVQSPPGDPVADPAAAADPAISPGQEALVLPEGVPPQIGEFAKAQGLSQGQLDATLQQFGGILQASETQKQDALRNLGEAHLKNWGSEADYKLNLARRALQQNDPSGGLAKALNESGYGNHPAVLDFLVTIGTSMKEGGFLKSAINRPPGKKTVAQAMYGDNHPSES